MTRRPFLVLLVALLPLTACASIPESSDPVAVEPIEEGTGRAAVNRPPDGADALGIVRSFVDSGATRDTDFEAGRLHLTDEARREWRPSNSLLVVDNVDTIPVPPAPNQPDSVQLVSLQADRVGRLRPDSSFVPDTGPYQVQLRVERNADGQWRISSPPPEMVISRGSFTHDFMPVPIYFSDPDRTRVVPDLRYVVSKPESTLPRRVIELLTAGPSATFRDAMSSELPPGVDPKTNVSEADDAALVVNFSDLGDLPLESRRIIAAQVVLSLQSVSKARVRLQEEGVPLLPDKQELWPSDVMNFEHANNVRADLPGLAVADERLYTLDQRARTIPGPAGDGGEYKVVQAAQSADGSELAAVTRTSTGVELRIGPYGEAMPATQLRGSFMSRPTWRGSDEVWTVVNGHDVHRAVHNGDTWTTSPVDVSEFAGNRLIKELRLSHDGTRAVGVVDGRIVVAGVVQQNGRFALRHPVTLGSPRAANITGVDWLSDKSLVATTDSNSSPVMEVSVDGFEWTEYASANLNQPVNAVTVGPGRRVVVSDQSGLWEAGDSDAVWSLLDGWRSLPGQSGGSIPFFPG